MKASYHANIECAILLIKEGANVNIKKRGWKASQFILMTCIEATYYEHEAYKKDYLFNLELLCFSLSFVYF
jgi:hypothetical protein